MGIRGSGLAGPHRKFGLPSTFNVPSEGWHLPRRLAVICAHFGGAFAAWREYTPAPRRACCFLRHRSDERSNEQACIVFACSRYASWLLSQRPSNGECFVVRRVGHPIFRSSCAVFHGVLRLPPQWRWARSAAQTEVFVPVLPTSHLDPIRRAR